MKFELFNEDCSPADPEVLHNAMMEWTGYRAAYQAMMMTAAEVKLPESKQKEIKSVMAHHYTAFVGMLFATNENLAKHNFTPYFTMCGIMGIVMELMFSAMIAERKSYGEDTSGGVMQEEFAQTCYAHMMNVQNAIAEQVNNGTFKLRVYAQMEAKTNAPTTTTRQ